MSDAQHSLLRNMIDGLSAVEGDNCWQAACPVRGRHEHCTLRIWEEYGDPPRIIVQCGYHFDPVGSPKRSCGLEAMEREVYRRALIVSGEDIVRYAERLQERLAKARRDRTVSAKLDRRGSPNNDGAAP
jgi:hypothetical protein